jgi:hypothetical protein
VRLRLKPQHHRDVKVVAEVIERVRRADRALAARFPRPVRKVISLGSEGLHVTFDRIEQLTRQKVAQTLREKYRREPSEQLEVSTKRIFGFFYGHHDTAYLFASPGEGGSEGFERFTLAHEAGHLFLEFYEKAIERLRQPSLLEAEESLVMAERDPPELMFMGLDEIPGSLGEEFQRRWRKRPLKEIKADGFAAEFLAPFEEIKALVKAHPGAEYAELTQRMRERFGLSGVAARVRLSQLMEEPSGDQEILAFLDG